MLAIKHLETFFQTMNSFVLTALLETLQFLQLTAGGYWICQSLRIREKKATRLKEVSTFSFKFNLVKY